MSKPPRENTGGSKQKAHEEAARTRRAEAVDKGEKLDTIEIQDKLAGRRRPPPRRGVDAIIDKSIERHPALVVGSLPAHAEVVFERDEQAGHLSRDRVQIVRVHPALVAALQSPIVVGDRVQVAELQSGQFYAIDAQPRRTLLARPVVEREKFPQPLVSNADQLWVVVAVAISDIWRYLPVLVGQVRERFSFAAQDLFITVAAFAFVALWEWLRWTIGLGVSPV